MFTICFKINNKNVALKMESREDSLIALPQRCEIIKYLSHKGDCVVLPEGIEEGLFVAGKTYRQLNTCKNIEYSRIRSHHKKLLSQSIGC